MGEQDQIAKQIAERQARQRGLSIGAICQQENHTMDNDAKRCRAMNKEGKPCEAAPTDTGFCYVHSSPGRAAELGREGGKKNRHFVESTLPPLPALNDSSGVRDAIVMILENAYLGKVAAKRIVPLIRLFSALERLSPVAQLEEKLKSLEQQLKQQKSQLKNPGLDPNAEDESS
jgi:hypothetical protein